MKLKSYYSDTVEAAVRLASVELGAEAVFLGSKKTGSLSEGRYEVTFALLDRKSEANAVGVSTSPDAQSSPAAPPPTPQEIWQGASAEQIESLLAQQGGAVSRAGYGQSHWREFVDSKRKDEAETLELAAVSASAEIVDPSSRRRSPTGLAVSAAPGPSGVGEATSVNDHGAKRQRDESVAGVSGGSPVSQHFMAAAPVRTPLFGFAATVRSSEKTISSPKKTQAQGPATGSWAMPEVHGSDLRDSVASLSRDVERLRLWLQNQFRSEQAVLLPSGELLTDPVLAEVYFYLLGNDIDAALAAQLVSVLRPAVEQGASRGRVRELLALRLQALFRTANGLGETGAGPRVAALVGPAGAGKTTALAKLAVRFGIGGPKRVHLLTVDPVRVGAVEQLQAYAGLLDMPLTPVSDLTLLPRLLSQLSQSSERPELVLIDTPGYGTGESERADHLADALSQVGGLDVHLVLNLTARPRDLRRGVEQYRVFRPAKLLFAKLDETDSYGPILNESVRTRLPLSFLSTGQRVPDDLTPATEERLIDLMLNKAWRDN